MNELLFQTFKPKTYVTVGKVSQLLETGKIISEASDRITIKMSDNSIATVDDYGRVTWED